MNFDQGERFQIPRSVRKALSDDGLNCGYHSCFCTSCKAVVSLLWFLCVCMSPSGISDSVTPWTVACQAPLSMEFSRQEYWSGLPFPSTGDLPNPGIDPGSLALQVYSLQSLKFFTILYNADLKTNKTQVFLQQRFFLGGSANNCNSLVSYVEVPT